jgi:ATP adenylyltransferase
MELLRTPWRFAYVTATGNPSAPCLFCQAADPATPDQHDDLVLLRTPLAYVILNRFPYNNGHVMVAPVRHIASLGAATEAELTALMHLTRDVELALTEGYGPHGINVGINLGRPAGAGIVDHVHIHLVPRWNGDTSFMSVIGNVRVLPEELSDTKKRLQPLLEKLQTRHP